MVTGTNPTGTITFSSSSSTASYLPSNKQCTLSSGSCSVIYTNTATKTLLSRINGFNGPDDIAFDSANNKLYVTDTSNVYSLDPSTSPATVTTITGIFSPDHIAFDSANNKLYVTDRSNGFIFSMDPSTSPATVTTITGINNADQIVFDSANNKLYVTDSNDNQIYSVDPSTSPATVTTIIGINSPDHIAFDSANNKLYATGNFDKKIYLMDPSTSPATVTVIANLTVSSSSSNIMRVDSRGDVYVTGIGNLVEINPSTNMITASIPLSDIPASIGFDSIHNNLYVGFFNQDYISVIDQSTNQVVGTIIEGNANPGGMAFDPTNNELYVTDNVVIGNQPTFKTTVTSIDTSAFSITDAITATYGGDSNNLGSLGMFDLTVLRQLNTISIDSASSTISSGDASSDQSSVTGVKVTISGTSAPTGTSVGIDTQSLNLQSNGVGTLDLTNINFFDVAIGGISDGNAQVCIQDSSADPTTTMLYWTGTAWFGASSVTVSGNTVCGTILVQSLTGTNIAVGDFPSPSIFVVADSDPKTPPVTGYDAGDTITVFFNRPTNEPLIAQTNNQYDTAHVNQLFSFSTSCSSFVSGGSIGTSYTGTWQDPSTFVITVSNVGGGFLSGLPGQIAFDSHDDKLYVTDNFDNRIQSVDPSTSPATVTTIASINSPSDIAFDSHDNKLYVIDNTDNQVYSVDPSTSPATVTTITGINNPDQIVFDSANNKLYVTDTSGNQIYSVNPSTSPATVTTITGIRFPSTIAFDSHDNKLYVTDSPDNQVYSVDPSTSPATVTTITGINNPDQIVFDSANNKLYVTGITNVFSLDPSTSPATVTTITGINNPDQIVFDSANNKLYVTDFQDNQVYSVDPSTSPATVTTITGINSPTFVTFDSANNKLYVTDSNDNQIYSVDPSTSPATVTLAASTPNQCIQVNSAAGLKNSQETSPISTSFYNEVPLPVQGTFDKDSGPIPISIVADDPKIPPMAGYDSGDTITIRFSEPTNTPLKTTKNNFYTKTDVNSLFPTLFSEFGDNVNLGNDYTGKWLDDSTFLITITDSTGASPTPIVGQMNGTITSPSLQNQVGTSSLPYTEDIVGTLTGSFSGFQGIDVVAPGGSLVSRLPSGVLTSFGLPSTATQSTVSALKTTAQSDVGTINYVGDVVDYTTGSSCSSGSGCTVSFLVTDDELKNAGLTLQDITFFHDINHDGIFESNEEIPFTITSEPTPGTHLITANIPSISKFAVGGVVSVLALLGGGGGAPTPPTLSGEDFAANEYPLSIGTNQFKLPNQTNVVPTNIIQAGAPIDVKILGSETGVADSIQGIALYTNLYGNNPHATDADTSIVYQEGQSIGISDPHGFFKLANCTYVDQNDKRLFDFKITFTKPMPTSDMIIRMWDKNKYTSDTVIINATQVTGYAYTVTDLFSSVQPVYKFNSTQNDRVTSIPIWIKNNAMWWADGKIDRQNFLVGIQYMVQNGIITVPQETKLSQYKSGTIPSWVKSDAGWWANGLIPDKEFIQAIQYLIDKGLVNPSGNTSHLGIDPLPFR